MGVQHSSLRGVRSTTESSDYVGIPEDDRRSAYTSDANTFFSPEVDAGVIQKVDGAEFSGDLDNACCPDHKKDPALSELLRCMDPDTTELDPLITASRHNAKNSPLVRLPKTVLVMVFGLLDACSFECLRRASADLACIADLYQQGQTEYPYLACNIPRPRSWPRPALTANYKTRFLQLLDRDRYCAGCRKAREAPNWELRVEKLRKYLYCSGCRVEHPACLFAMPQRRREDSDRVCIGHKGFLRLCDHDEGRITWRRFKFLHEQLHFAPNKQDQMIVCPHESHVVSCKTLREKETSTETSSIPNLRPIDCGDRPAHRTCNDCTRPLLCAVRNYKEVSSTVMRWTAHLDTGDETSAITRQYLVERLAELSRSGGRFLCPPIGPGQSIESRCFDPKRCDCIFMKGRCNEKIYPLHVGIGWLEKETRAHLGVPGSFPSSRPWSSCHIWPLQHKSTRPFATSYNKGGLDNVSVYIRPCHTGQRCLAVDYRREWKPEHNISNDVMGPSWFHSLDHDSYGLKCDAESYQICWCREEQCLNFYGYMRGFSRFLRRSDYRRECHGS